MTDTAPNSVPQAFRLPGFVYVAARWQRQNADVVTNTFFFRSAATDGDLADIRARLDAFYFGKLEAQPYPVAALLSPAITGLSYYMRATDAPIGDPGQEFAAGAQLAGLTRGTAQLPPDLAICASYRAEPPVTARRRGRIFIGPLVPGALDQATGLVMEGARASINEACRGLASASQTAPVRWVIASRAAQAAAEITNGYVDAHFDVQRRRDPGAEVFGRRASVWQVAPEVLG